LLGNPEGIERLGGIDFDEAVFAHVAAAIGGAIQQLDPADPVAVAAVARLRAECVEAKEALSADTEVSIPVMLPNINTSVRLTRNEFEGMIRPALADTLVALRRALRSAGVEPGQLASVLLVGGSSRIPLVAQLVGAELGRPVAVDAHPKHGVSMGAALVAADPSTAAATPVAADPVTAAPPVAAAPMPPPVAAAPPPAPPVAPPPANDPSPTVPVAAATAPVAAAAAAPPSSPPPGGPTFERPGFPPSRDVPLEPSSTGDGGGGKRIGLIVAAVVAVAAVVGGVLIFAGDDDPGDVSSTTLPDETTTVLENTTTTIADPCAGVAGRCIRIDSIELGEGDAYTVEWTAFNFQPVVADSPDEFHAHFFWNVFEPSQAGTNSDNPGQWDLTADQPFAAQTVTAPSARPDDADEMCVVVATFEHAVDDPSVFHCFPVPDA
jgi:molecular chaperone DnaK